MFRGTLNGLWMALAFSLSQVSAVAISPLYERGYTVMPEPQKVTLGGKAITSRSSRSERLEPWNDVIACPERVSHITSPELVAVAA